jgi:hypothetical protein
VSHASQDGVGAQVIVALRELFGQLADPRMLRGKRHELGAVLTVTVLAAPAGACNFQDVGDRAGELPQPLLALAGTGVYPPAGPYMYRWVVSMPFSQPGLTRIG